MAQMTLPPPPHTRTQGRAPIWSSCPCVMMTASILSFHWCKKLVSGRIFCMPRSVKLERGKHKEGAVKGGEGTVMSSIEPKGEKGVLES